MFCFFWRKHDIWRAVHYLLHVVVPRHQSSTYVLHISSELFSHQAYSANYLYIVIGRQGFWENTLDAWCNVREVNYIPVKIWLALMSAYHIHLLQYLTKKASGLPLSKYSSVGAMYSYVWKCIYNRGTPDRSECTTVPSCILNKTVLAPKTVN